MSKFCSAPFKAIYMHQNQPGMSSFSACCHLPRSYFDGAYTLAQYLAHPNLEKLKDIFKNGKELPKECSKCRAIESAVDNPAESLRLQHNNYLNCHSYDGDEIITASLFLSNLCNLSCDICQSKHSFKKGKHEVYLDELGLRPKEEYIVSDPFVQFDLDSIIPIIKKIKSIAIAGGEPFSYYDKPHLRLLSELEKNCDDVLYVTNGTIWPTKLVEDKLIKIKRLHIRVSIDGMNEQFAYARYPGEWSTVLTNLDKWDDLLSRTNNLKLHIKTAVSVFNILWLSELMAFVADREYTHEFNLVTYPDYYNIQCFPIETKDKIASDLLEKSDNPKIKELIDFMYDVDKSDLFNKTKQIIYESDKNKGIYYNKLFPIENAVTGLYD